MTNRISKLIHAYAQTVITGKSSEHPTQRSIQFIISWILKIGISGLALGYIFQKLQGETVIIESTLNVFFGLTNIQVMTYTFLAAFLIAANWGLEMVKWNLLIAPNFDSRWTTAVKGVLSGATFGIFTPNRIGEFVGRILALNPKQRISGSVLSFVNGLSQTLATLTFGVIGCLFLLESLAVESLGDLAVRLIQVTLIAFWVLCMIFYLNLNFIGVLFERSSKLALFTKYLAPVSSLSTGLLHKLFVLSIIRFATFLGQYFLLFSLMLSEPDWIIIGGASMLSLFSSTVFSLVPVPDLILREAIALSYFGLFEFDLGIVSSVVFAVWVLNIAIPALVGSIVLLSYRIFRPT